MPVPDSLPEAAIFGGPLITRPPVPRNSSARTRDSRGQLDSIVELSPSGCQPHKQEKKKKRKGGRVGKEKHRDRLRPTLGDHSLLSFPQEQRAAASTDSRLDRYCCVDGWIQLCSIRFSFVTDTREPTANENHSEGILFRRRHVVVSLQIVVSLMSGRRPSDVPVILTSGRRRSYVPVILVTSHDRPIDVIPGFAFWLHSQSRPLACPGKHLRVWIGLDLTSALSTNPEPRHPQDL